MVLEPMQTNGKTLRDLALDSVPQSLREPLLALAAQHNITTPDDPFWTIIAATANALVAAKVAGRAADRLGTAVDSIPNKILEGTQLAGADLSKTIAAVLTSKIEQAGTGFANVIVAAADKGKADLQSAAAEIQAERLQDGDEFVEKWKKDLIQSINRALYKPASRHDRWIYMIGMALVGGIVTATLLLMGGKLITTRGLSAQGLGSGTIIQISRPSYWTRDCPPGELCLTLKK
jgi:hypothetical protein